MQIIPFKEPASWREQIELDGDIFILEFAWNALNEFWTMSIYNRDLIPLLHGVKIVPNYPLLAQYVFTDKPKGEIICHNIVGGTNVIRRFDMSQRFELVYYSEGELEAIAIETEAANEI